MPPKKKQRLAPGKSAGGGLGKASDVPPARMELKAWISDVYAGRHGFAEGVKKKFPLDIGGTFLEVVQRCWADESSMIAQSCEFCKKIGLIKCDSTNDYFAEMFVSMKEPASSHTTHKHQGFMVIRHCSETTLQRQASRQDQPIGARRGGRRVDSAPHPSFSGPLAKALSGANRT